MKKLITDISKLEGETIEKASLIDCGESVGFIFSDDTYAIFDVNFYGDSHDIEILDDVCDTTKLELGVITEDEYNEIISAQKAEREERIKQRELSELKRLSEKYKI